MKTREDILSLAQQAQRDVMLDLMGSLAAAISLLERYPKAKQAAPSNKMFGQMLIDYRASLDRARQYLAAAPEPPAAEAPKGGAGDDLVARLWIRAEAARAENSGTGLGDALHFEEAARAIEYARSLVPELRTVVGRQRAQREEAEHDTLAAEAELRLVRKERAEAEAMVAKLADQLMAKAAEAPGQEPVAVKALEWKELGSRGSDVEAETILGAYTLCFDEPSAGGAVNLYMAGADDDTFTVHRTRDAAKAAAQADYQQRIRSALVSAPTAYADAEAEVAVAICEAEWGRNSWSLVSNHSRSKAARHAQAALAAIRSPASPFGAGEGQ